MQESYRLRTLAFVVAIPVLYALSMHVRALGGDVLAWAQPILSGAFPNTTPVKSTVADHFASAPAAGAPMLLTAGSGSRWVYDRAHRIAAWSEQGDLTGNEILYVDTPPPGSLPSRDLSHVVTARGLHLGITPAQAARVFGLSPSAVHQSILYVSARMSKCPPGPEAPCENDAVIKFRGGQAYSIGLFP
jgi:hypothetical protein